MRVHEAGAVDCVYAAEAQVAKVEALVYLVQRVGVDVGEEVADEGFPFCPGYGFGDEGEVVGLFEVEGCGYEPDIA